MIHKNLISTLSFKYFMVLVQNSLRYLNTCLETFESICDIYFYSGHINLSYMKEIKI